MSSEVNRRRFIQKSLITSAGGAMALNAADSAASAQNAAVSGVSLSGLAATKADFPTGAIGDLKISRLLLGGNLLTHFTHSRDLRYVYNLTANYNTVDKILETMALAESHGVNTLVIHTAVGVVSFLKRYRHERGGKMNWIICPTAEIDDKMEAYAKQVRELVDEGVDAIYLWGVRGDDLVSKGRMDLVAKAVQTAKDMGVPSGVGAHDLQVIRECEKHNIDADFYIKTFHHHNYQTAPRPEELTAPIREVPGYWCKDPAETIDVMKSVSKPWIAFKVMAAGAIPPANAFRYAFENGADHVLAGMFDFEIAEDVRIAKDTLNNVKRSRPWRS